MLQLGFHTPQWYRPSGIVVVHLVLSRTPDLAGAAGGQHEELEGERCRPVRIGPAHPLERLGDLCVRKRLLVLAVSLRI